MMNSNDAVRDAMALHQQALDLRSFLLLHEFQMHEKAPADEDDGANERRAPSLTTGTFAAAPNGTGVPELRRGIILFDAKDLHVDTQPGRRRPFQLQLDVPDLEDSDLSDDDEEEGEARTQENVAENGQDGDNQTTHDTEAHAEATAKRDRLRNMVIEEICSTERSYVHSIRTLHDFYIVPLEDNKHPIMEDAQIAVFFNNLRQLVMLNSKLLNDLTDIVEKRRNGAASIVPLPSPVLIKTDNQKKTTPRNVGRRGSTSPIAQAEGIGAVFCRYAPLFKLYGGYAKDYEEVAQLLQSYKRDSRLGFAQFLETCKQRSGSDKSFESLLIMPIQRIPRYKLLLERICEYTPSGHPDEMFLKQAVYGVSDAASLINETVRDQENLESVLEAQKLFVGQVSLCTPNRRLIRKGMLIKMSTKRHEEVMLHLFNDILLYSGVLITGGYRVRRVVQLNSKAVRVRTQIPSSYRTLFHRRNLKEDCGFVVTSLEKTFVLFASSPEERTMWVNDINAAIQQAQKDSRTDSTETPADAAALWVPDSVAGACSVCLASFKVYFRRHHCRRCGAVVCGNCSDHRSIVFAGDCSREERVCTPCYRVLQLVKKAAFTWLSLVVEFSGVLRRKRWNKWTEHYFELKAGILKQYTLASASSASYKCCTDTLDLTGAIVIHRSDERSQKNRFSFQISTSDFYDEDGDNNQTSPTYPTPATRNTTLMKKLSPLKAAVVSRFADGSARRRESMSVLSSEGSMSNLSRSYSGQDDSTGWILCAASYEGEMAWSNAIQRSADKALTRARRSRVTEYSFPMPFERINSLPASPSHMSSDLVDSLFDEASKLERRRMQIMKEILRSEESYVTCLGECIQMYVQPLMLRQLEAQKRLRRKQSRSKRSMFEEGANALSAAASAVAQRTYNNANLPHLGSLRKMASGGSSRALTASDSSRTRMNASNTATKMLVLDADMAIFFSSIDQLCTLNQQLLEHLSRHMSEVRSEDSDDSVYRPGAIFNAYAPLFQLYTSYASRHEAAQNVIESAQFASFLKEIPEEASLHRLRTYLNMPMERIPRYKVFLQELMECTPPDHVDYAPLQTAIKSVNMVANKVQEIIARRASARKVEEISARVGVDLKGRRFVREGTLKKVCRSKVQKYSFYLFEDAIVYGRMGSGLQKKKFRLIELGECKIQADTGSMPEVINAVAGSATSETAFYFFSPLKSFILVADSPDGKLEWTTCIQECIEKTVRGPVLARRGSVRSELLLDDDDPTLASDIYLENALVIKNGWLNLLSDDPGRRSRRMWITLTQQSISFATTFKGAQPEEMISIELCEAVPSKEPTFFRLHVRSDNQRAASRQAYTFETQSQAEREEWLRALHHCISATNVMEMRRRSLNSATLAPIFMFNKMSNVCTICCHSFAVYRPRHHCRVCGCLVCGNCSKRKWALSYSSSKKASRVCDNCADGATSSASSFVSDV